MPRRRSGGNDHVAARGHSAGQSCGTPDVNSGEGSRSRASRPMVVWVGDGAPCNRTLTRPGCAADPRLDPRRGAGRRLRQGPAGEGSPWLRRAKTTGGADVRGPEAIIAEMIECIPEVDKAVLRGHSPGALELGQPPGDRTLGRQRLSLRSPGQARYGSLLYGRPQSDRAPPGTVSCKSLIS